MNSALLRTRPHDNMCAGVPLLAVAGEKATIRVIHVGRMKAVASLQVRPAPCASRSPSHSGISHCSLLPSSPQGHGRSINDLRFLPSDPNMLLSCSSDESCRLWNVVTLQLAVIFGGWHGHRSAVLSLDVHVLGCMFASCGMDNRRVPPPPPPPLLLLVVTMLAVGLSGFHAPVRAVAPYWPPAAFECGRSTVQM